MFAGPPESIASASASNDSMKILTHGLNSANGLFMLSIMNPLCAIHAANLCHQHFATSQRRAHHAIQCFFATTEDWAVDTTLVVAQLVFCDSATFALGQTLGTLAGTCQRKAMKWKSLALEVIPILGDDDFPSTE